MNLHKNIEDAISSSLSSVASLTPFSSADWTNYHIFRGYGGELLKGISRGRLPIAFINRVNSSYAIESIGDSTGGTVESSYQVTFIVGNTSRTDEKTNEEYLYQLATAFLSDLRKKWMFRQGNEEIGPIIPISFGFKLEITIRVDLSYDQDSR